MSRPGEITHEDSWPATMQTDLARWCERNIYTPERVNALELLEKICDELLLDLFQQLRVPTLLTQPRTARELASALGFVDTADIALEAMLARLARYGVLVSQGTDTARTFTLTGKTVERSDLEATRRQLISINPRLESAVAFLEFGARYFVRCLRDDKHFFDHVLTGKEKELYGLWHAATNEDPLQDAHGLLGARVVADISPRSILEVGGGTGNGILRILQEFERRGDLENLTRYVFTDISQQFVLKTRRAIRETFPNVTAEWRFLDINAPFDDQKVAAQSVEMVYGVNAAHIARDVVAFLRDCHRTLTPGGHIVFSERLRPTPDAMAPRELALNLSEYHRTAAIRHPRFRPSHAYLTSDAWLAAVEEAGFVSGMICPNFSLFEKPIENPYAVVVVAQKA